MSYSVTLELDVSDMGLLRLILKNVSKGKAAAKQQGFIDGYMVKPLEDDILPEAAKYILKQMPKRGA